VAPYPFTTHAPLPGMMPFEDIQVQLVDTPAVAAARTEPYMPNLVHNADGVVLVLDPTEDDPAELLEGCRPVFDKARVWPRGVPLPGEASPLTTLRTVLAVLNKADLDEDGAFADLARPALWEGLPVMRVSATRGAGLQELKDRLFSELHVVRVYAKEPGKKPDLERPFVLPAGSTVHDLAVRIHKDIAEHLKYARLWGHARFEGQQVERHHVLLDRDVVELHG